MTELAQGVTGERSWTAAEAPMPLVRFAPGEQAVRVRYGREGELEWRSFLLLLRPGEELTEAMVGRAISERQSR